MGLVKPADYVRRDRLAEIVSEVADALDKGGLPPWRKPWREGQITGTPRNLRTGAAYRGGNVLILSFLSPFGGSDERWCSFKQAESLGLSVKKGAKSAPIMWFSVKEVDDKEGRRNENGEVKTAHVPMIRLSSVFHVSQLDGPVPPPPDAAAVPPAAWTLPDAFDIMAANSGIPIREGGIAAYSPTTDEIVMPPRSSFFDADGCTALDAYCATLAHEWGHSTGHESRCARDLTGRRGTSSYAFEELVAELASVMTLGRMGRPYDLPQHASYLDSWASMLRDKKDPMALWRAASLAQKASDFAMGWHPEFKAALAAEDAARAALDAATDDDQQHVHPVALPADVTPAGPPSPALSEVGRDDGQSAQGKPYQYFDNGQLVTITVPFVPGDPVRDAGGHVGTVTGIMRRGESVCVRWDAGGREDVLPAACLTASPPALFPPADTASRPQTPLTDADIADAAAADIAAAAARAAGRQYDLFGGARP